MPAPARQLPNYRIEVPAFSGPLDLLLHLIERDELDITVISLARVTEQYLAQIEHLKQERIEDLIDFLVIGARLVLIKSRALLPKPPALPGEDVEEDPATALLRQLRQYKAFKSAAQWLHGRTEHGLRTYLRVAPPPQLESKLDLSGVGVVDLLQAVTNVLARAVKQEESVTVVRQRRLTIEGQIAHLRKTLALEGRTSFRDLLSQAADRVEVAITLLAILELIKRREAVAHQSQLFGPIEIYATGRKSGTAQAEQATRPSHQ